MQDIPCVSVQWLQQPNGQLPTISFKCLVVREVIVIKCISGHPTKPCTVPISLCLMPNHKFTMVPRSTAYLLRLQSSYQSGLLVTRGNPFGVDRAPNNGTSGGDRISSICTLQHVVINMMRSKRFSNMLTLFTMYWHAASYYLRKTRNFSGSLGNYAAKATIVIMVTHLKNWHSIVLYIVQFLVKC